MKRPALDCSPSLTLDIVGLWAVNQWIGTVSFPIGHISGVNEELGTLLVHSSRIRREQIEVSQSH